jgi:hypothetical protein
VRIKLLENGLDSLKKGFEKLHLYEEMHHIDRSGPERYFVLKDAVLAIHHGVEILFKEVLNRQNELLVFEAIDKQLKAAFVTKRQMGLDSLFETNSKLRTVSFDEAIDRVQTICGYELRNEFRSKLDRLQECRNQIIHSEVSVDEIHLNSIFAGLVDEIDVFFSQAIGREYSTITGYAQLQDSYQKYLASLDETKARINKMEAIGLFLKAIQTCSLAMGENEVKIVESINTATKFVDVLCGSTFQFGTDLYNGHCSGDIRIKRHDEGHFCIQAKDILWDYVFRFKSLLVFMPGIEGDFSPILFFEAAEDVVDKSIRGYAQTDHCGRRYLEGIHFPDEGRTEWIPEKVREFHFRRLEDEKFHIPRFQRIQMYIDAGVFCFVNVKTLDYGRINSIPSDYASMSLKEIGVHFRKALEKPE